jgi:hypothetical protein
MAQVNALVAPTKATVSTVLKWIAYASFLFAPPLLITFRTFKTHSVELKSDFVVVNVSCRVAESMLATKYFRFTSGRFEVFRADGPYSLPRDISRMIIFN